MDEHIYSWETDYEKSWEALKEADGVLQRNIDSILQKSKSGSLVSAKHKQNQLRLSMMRHLFIIIDLSESMISNANNMSDNNNANLVSDDYRPNKAVYVLKVIKKFIEEFFDLNPLGQICIIYTCNKRAEKISELSGNPAKHVKAIDSLISHIRSISDSNDVMKCGVVVSPLTLKPGGEASLQNSLVLASRTLRHVSRYTSREVLAVFGSLSTCDPGDIHATIQDLRAQRIVCSLVCLSAEVYLYKRLCRETGGTFRVALDSDHFETIILKGGHHRHDTANGNETIEEGSKAITTTVGGNEVEGGVKEGVSSHDNPSRDSDTAFNSFLEPPPSRHEQGESDNEATLVKIGFPRYYMVDGGGNNVTFDPRDASFNAAAGSYNSSLNVSDYRSSSTTSDSAAFGTALGRNDEDLTTTPQFSACACHLTDPPAGTEKLTTMNALPKEEEEVGGEVCTIVDTERGRERGRPFRSAGYLCPVCKAKYCELPVECRVCGLTLVSAPHLARSYAHLFPPDPFYELPYHSDDHHVMSDTDLLSCYGCSFPISVTTANVYKCTRCSSTFCPECTLFVHETLHSCPGCATLKRTQSS